MMKQAVYFFLAIALVFASCEKKKDETGTKDPESGPPSGFVTEPGTDQTHNVIATLPQAHGINRYVRQLSRGIHCPVNPA